MKRIRFYNDPHWQLRIHWTGFWVWLCVMGAVLFLPVFKDNLSALLIMEVSLYANLITHLGAISGAESALLSEKQLEESHDTNR